MNYFNGIPAVQVRFIGAFHGPIPTKPMGQAAAPQGSTKPLCLCKLQRQKDEERRGKNRKWPEGRNS